jgi:hypothetical protein
MIRGMDVYLTGDSDEILRDGLREYKAEACA